MKAPQEGTRAQVHLCFLCPFAAIHRTELLPEIGEYFLELPAAYASTALGIDYFPCRALATFDRAMDSADVAQAGGFTGEEQNIVNGTRQGLL